MQKSILFLSLISVYLCLFVSNADALRTEGVCSQVYYANSTCFKSKFLCENGVCIERGLYCNGRDDCGDSSDETNCIYVSADYCKPEMKRCGDTGKSIPDHWFCDGVLDCPYGEDENSCEDARDDGNPIKAKVLQWLSMQKQSQHDTEMWGSFVDKFAVAFHLADNAWITRDYEIRRQMAYEISIQLLSRLSKIKLRDIPSSDLASYVNAFLVTCLDPRKFYGLNLVQELRNRVNRQNYTNPYVFLSLCNAGDNITFTDEIKLLNTFISEHREFWTDIQAIAVMALACASQQPGNAAVSRELPHLVLELKRHQYSNGTAENLQTTALVMQAIFSAEPDADPANFDENKALHEIFAMQKPDGSFGDFMDTYYVLPLLNCKSFVNISSDHCESPHKDEISALEDLTYISGPEIRVRYSLSIRNDKNLERYLALRVPVNTSFYGVMEMAADIDTRFSFEYVMKDNKPYVNALSGLKDNPEENKFWFMYVFVEGKPSLLQDSPVDVILEQNEHFLMWYQRGRWND